MTWLGSGIFCTTEDWHVECTQMMADGQPCMWSGEVEVEIDDYGRGYWECPECGAETQEYVEDRRRALADAWYG